MMAGASKTKGDWKENIITNPPEDQEQEDDVLGVEDQAEAAKELKHKIVTLVEEGKNSKEEIIEEIDRPAYHVEDYLEILKDEGVLEVIG